MSFLRRISSILRSCGESFNLAGFLYDEDYLREQIYLMMLDFSEAERDGMSAEDYLGKNPKKKN